MIAALTDDDVRALLLMDIGAASHLHYCLIRGIRQAQLSQFLNRLRGPNPAILKALRLKRVALYVSATMPTKKRRSKDRKTEEL